MSLQDLGKQFVSRLDKFVAGKMNSSYRTTTIGLLLYSNSGGIILVQPFAIRCYYRTHTYYTSYCYAHLAVRSASTGEVTLTRGGLSPIEITSGKKGPKVVTRVQGMEVRAAYY
jgi:hypothetical protein